MPDGYRLQSMNLAYFIFDYLTVPNSINDLLVSVYFARTDTVGHQIRLLITLIYSLSHFY